MNKIIVIDGLARSGTTLLTAIFNSQNCSKSYRGIFHEPLAFNYASWPHGYARHAPIKMSELKFGSNFTCELRSRLGLKAKTGVFYQSVFVKQALKTITDRKQFQTSNLEDWKALFKKTRLSSFNELDLFYQKLAEIERCKLLFLRWNQGYSYLDVWLRNPIHFWLVVVRNPLARAYSHLRSHKCSYQNSLYNSIAFAKRIDEISSNNAYSSRVKIIYYEDLLVNQKMEIEEIYSFLGEKINHIELSELYNSDGKPYRVESSSRVDQGLDRKMGDIYHGIDLTKMNSFRDKVPEEIVEKFKSNLENFKVYERYF